MSFIEATIGELEAQGCFVGIQDGNHGEKHPKSSDYVPDGVPFIMASDISSGRVDVASASKLPQSITDNLRIGFCHGGDVLLSHKGSVGYVAIAPQHDPYLMLTPQVTYYRVNPKKVSARFLSYAFRDPMFQKRLLSTAGQQGTRGYVGIKAQRQLKVRFCPLSLQERIVDAISPYDDLIENNRRRIALLEEAARMLYREWFVHFRFPGHNHVKIIEGLPEGWERKQIAELAEIFRGKSYSSQELVDEGGQPFVNLKCLQRFGGFRASGLKGFRGSHKEHHLLVPGDIIVAVTDMTRDAMIVAQAARIPRTVGEQAIYSMDLVKAVPKDDVEHNWFYSLLRFSPFSAEVREEATGATVLHLKPKHIEAWRAPVPTAHLRALFAEQVGTILNQIDNLELQSERLAKARDLLLPRLMNGEFPV